MYWKSITTNSGRDALYLSGYTYTMTPFSIISTEITTVAAKYSLQTMSYIWIKAYYPYKRCVS